MYVPLIVKSSTVRLEYRAKVEDRGNERTTEKKERKL